MKVMIGSSRIFQVGRFGKPFGTFARCYSKDIKNFHFPDASEYAIRPLNEVTFQSIYGINNLPQTTKDIIKMNTNDPIITSPEDFEHYKNLYNNFYSKLGKQQLDFKMFTNQLFKSIRLQSTENPEPPLIHGPGKIITSMFDTTFDIILDKEIPDNDIALMDEIIEAKASNATNYPFMANRNIDMFTEPFCFSDKDEFDVSVFYRWSLLLPVQSFITMTSFMGEKTRVDLESFPVDIRWLFDKHVLDGKMNDNMRRAVMPDFKISLKSGDIKSYLPIKMKTRIVNEDGQIPKKIIKESVIQSLLSQSGIGILSDSRKSLMYEISKVEMKNEKVTVSLNYKLVDSSQIKVTEATVLLFFLLKLKHHHRQLVTQGYSTQSGICSETLAMIKRTRQDSTSIMNSYFLDYIRYCWYKDEKISKLPKFTLKVPKATAEKLGYQQNWESFKEPVQFYNLKENDLKNSTIHQIKDNEQILIRPYEGKVSLLVADDLINSSFRRWGNESDYKFDYEDNYGDDYKEETDYNLAFEMNLMSHLEKYAKPGLNNPYLLKGFIKIVSEDGTILSCGKFYMYMDNREDNDDEKEVEFEKLQPKIAEQIEFYKQSGIELRRSPTKSDIMVTNDNRVFLKLENLYPEIAFRPS